MTLEEAAKVLGLSTRSIREYIKKGVLQATKVRVKKGKEWNLDPGSVEKFKRDREAGVIFPSVVEASGRAEVPAEIQTTRLPVELPRELPPQAIPIPLGPSRSSQTTGRYLDSIPDVLDIEEAAVFLSVSPYTVRSLLKDGTLHGLKLGRSWRITKLSLERFIRKSSR